MRTPQNDDEDVGCVGKRRAPALSVYRNDGKRTRGKKIGRKKRVDSHCCPFTEEHQVDQLLVENVYLYIQ